MAFKDIKGHQQPLRILQEHMRHQRLANGYLFVGPEGLGKHLTARTLAKAVNCQAGSVDSCDICPSCRKIDAYQHPDVLFVADTDEVVKIEQVRQLQQRISLKPYEARRKVCVIDNAHHLTAEAANALLKVLEEPPAESLIILVSAKPTLLFKTIVSRCRAVTFSPLERAELAKILQSEYGLRDEAARFLAYFSEGRIGQALRLKDGDILGEKNRVLDAFFSSGREGQLSLEDKSRLRGYLNILATWFRDMSLVKIGMPHSELINYDRRSDLLGSMQQYSFGDIDEIVVCISNSILYLEQNVNIKLLLSNLRAELTRI
ncbi:MAG TPA: DNA polymerase III subunit delta' [Patescibacteria group bacterium]|nr:DNA polymerase III subunit delta' [Patescibacteria group bacterium]